MDTVNAALTGSPRWEDEVGEWHASDRVRADKIKAGFDWVWEESSEPIPFNLRTIHGHRIGFCFGLFQSILRYRDARPCIICRSEIEKKAVQQEIGARRNVAAG